MTMVSNSDIFQSLDLWALKLLNVHSGITYKGKAFSKQMQVFFPQLFFPRLAAARMSSQYCVTIVSLQKPISRPFCPMCLHGAKRSVGRIGVKFANQPFPNAKYASRSGVLKQSLNL